jgi:Scavenger mRNA decapping enzyme C-term binding
MLQEYDTILCVETPRAHASLVVQQWVDAEAHKPSKRWIHDVIHKGKEEANIRLKTSEYILLPDVAPPLKYRLFQWHQSTRARFQRSCLQVTPEVNTWQKPRLPRIEYDRAHWLAIITDAGLRSIRDLRGKHLTMLRTLERHCTEAILKEHPSLRREDVMVFANYPPSVYQLHFHVCVPFKKQAAYDAFRIHPLHTIINNLTVSDTFYRDSSFKVPVQRNSDLCQILTQWTEDDSDTDESNESNSFTQSTPPTERRTLEDPPEALDTCFVIDL